MTRCNWSACDWRHDPNLDVSAREQLHEHAESCGHPLCSVCHASLSDSDPALSCEKCLTAVRENLAGISLMYDELPRHLRVVGAQAYDRELSGDGERVLPGGTVLGLLAPGSAGGEARRLSDADRFRLEQEPIRWWLKGAVGPLTSLQWSLAQNEAEGREHVVDNRPNDTPSISWSLASWEMDWRETRNDPPPPHRGSVTAAVRGALRYLDVHARWAAGKAPAFADFARDMRDLHTILEIATGRLRNPTKAAASCFDCGGNLVRRVTAEGIEEQHVTCDRCRRQYTPAAYTLALAARRAEGLAGWVTVPAAATASHRSVKTLRAWINAELVSASCRVADKAMIVWYPDVQERAERAQRRATRGNSQSA